MTDQQVQPTMPSKIKGVYFVLTLMVMGSFAASAVMIAKSMYGFSVLFLLLATLLAGAGFSLKRRFMK